MASSKIYLGGWNENPVYMDYERMLSCNGKNANYGRIEAADIYSYVGGYNFINATIRTSARYQVQPSQIGVEGGRSRLDGQGHHRIRADPYTDILVHGHNGLLNPLRQEGRLGTRRSASL
jgi:hypothetical protein